jgi:hypothetical protein
MHGHETAAFAVVNARFGGGGGQAAFILTRIGLVDVRTTYRC